MAGQINEDMSLVAAGEGGEVVDYYGLVNISDPSKVGTQGSDAEKQVRTDALVNNVCGYTHTRCNALRRAATHCSIPQQTATYRITLQHTATHCSVQLTRGCRSRH